MKKILPCICGFILLEMMAFKDISISLLYALPLTDTTKWPTRFGFGHTPTPQEIIAWDIDVRPDGKGLPDGQGDATLGKVIYIQKCSACHGLEGAEQPIVRSSGTVLIGDTVLKSKRKTIGNYWPYATTLFDYIRRAMPYSQPGSLTDDEVYGVTAYLLNANRVIKANVVLNEKTLPRIIMPAKKLFIFDDRKGGPEVK